MRFYYDLDLGKLVTSPGFSTSINLVDWKRGDASQITLGFYRGTQQVLLEGTPQLKFALKPSGQFDADPVVSTDSWILGDESNKDYIANPSFNTVELNALFNHADGDPTNDLEKVGLMFEFTWSTDGGSTWTSTETVKSNVYNDVIKGTEGVPLAGSPAYPGPEEIQVLSEKGQPDGYASLGSDGKVPASELPSYVDDVLEYADLATFPGTGDTGKIYVALDSGLVYRWSGSTYVQIAAGDHSHSNLAVLDATTEAFTSTELNNINYNTANNHTHANQTILDATTASFTAADETKLAGIEDNATKGGTKQDGTTNAITPKLDTKSGSVAGNARGNEALDTQTIRNAATQVASGARSLILGGNNNTASGAQSAVVSAANSTASGTGAVVIGGENNTSSGYNSEVLGSQTSTASGIGSSVVGGSACNVSGNWGITVGGLNHQITQPRSGIFAGHDNTVNHINSVILGGSNITSDAADTAFVPNLNVGGGFKMPTGASAGYVLTTDANGVGAWAEVEQPVGGASWVYNSSGYNDQIHGDIPDGWRNIAAKTADQLVVIGTSCTSIGSMAFVGHNNADGGLVIPDSVTSMGTFAFQSYAASGTIKGELYLSKNLTRIEMGVFQIAKFIGELILPAGLTYIGSNAFSSGTYTGDLIIPPLVTELGNNSFYGNASLGSKLTLPESLTTIGTQSFRNCSGITTIDCFTTKTALDVSDSLLGSGVATIHARATDSTWTAGSGQTIGGKTGITVIKDL